MCFSYQRPEFLGLSSWTTILGPRQLTTTTSTVQCKSLSGVRSALTPQLQCAAWGYTARTSWSIASQLDHSLNPERVRHAPIAPLRSHPTSMEKLKLGQKQVREGLRRAMERDDSIVKPWTNYLPYIRFIYIHSMSFSIVHSTIIGLVGFWFCWRSLSSENF